ncbi:MAG: TonB-dependent receptor, partial [Pseudomonadota bacterium]
MNSRNLASTRSRLLAVAVATALSGTALAAETGGSQPASVGALEEVIVTGTKRQEASQDVPIAISAISAADLQRSPINDVRALANLAPGLVLSNPAGFNATGGGMRGTGTNIILVTQDAPVSFLMDEFVLSHVTSQFLTLFDTQQIEVYRGPQGTLFGKNTTGGVIAVTSKRPELGEYGAETQFSYGQYRNGADNASVKAAINVPLGETLALRVAAIYDTDQGYYTNDKATATYPRNVPIWGAFGIPAGTLPPAGIDLNNRGTGGRLGGKDVIASKAKLLWQPNDSYSAYLIGEVVRDRSDSPPGVNESTATDLLTALGFPGIQLARQRDVFSTAITGNADIKMDQGHKVDTEGLYLTQTLSLAAGEIKSITGYRQEQQRLPSTYTGEAFLTLFDSTRNTERFTFQQELRFASDFDGPFNFVTGANYFQDTFNFRAFFQVGLVGLIPSINSTTGTALRPDGRVNLDTSVFQDYQLQTTKQNRKEYAVYWDGNYDLTDKFTLTAGVRFSKDEKDFDRLVDGGGLCNSFTPAQDRRTVNGVCRDVRSQNISRAGILPKQWDGRSEPLPRSSFGTDVLTSDSWNEVTWRAVLDYKPVDGQLWYRSYATGFLSGGFSETCATVSRCAYDPETYTNNELGYKADLFDNRLRLNVAAYYTEYDNLQRAVVAVYQSADGSSQQETVTVNTGTSEATGVDVEATWVPTDNLRIGLSVNWLDHSYGSGSVLPDLRGTNQPVDLTRFDVPFSPELKAGVTLAYDMALAAGSRLTWQADVNHQAEAETDVFNGLNTQMEERTLLGASVTYHDPNDRWSATLYGANLSDEVYRVAALPVAGLWNFT